MKYIAGIVLYNPDLGRLKENIESICKQVDKVILIDNGSDNIREIEDLIKEYLNCILLNNICQSCYLTNKVKMVYLLRNIYIFFHHVLLLFRIDILLPQQQQNHFH